MGVIPIVNENDTLAVAVGNFYTSIPSLFRLAVVFDRVPAQTHRSQEIKFGDNDTLSAITAAMVQADYLFLMTDVDCLYDKNPRTNPDAKAIEVVEDISTLEADGMF